MRAYTMRGKLMTPSRTRNGGLVICVLLGVVDILGLAGLGADDGPPAAARP